MGGGPGLTALKRLRWDTHIPALAVLLREAQTAERYLCELEASHHADITRVAIVVSRYSSRGGAGG